MNADIHVLTGPAGSGKTDRMLARYRTCLRDAAEKLEIGRSLWLTPTHFSAAQIREQLLTPDLGACFNPQVFTFSGFADRVLRDSPAQVTPISRTLQRILVRGLIDQLHTDGRLPYFAPIAETSGFVDQVLSFIAELKQAEVWPEHFDEVIAAGPPHPRDQELAQLYRDYQKQLLAHELYDGEGRFWSARDQLAQGNWGTFQDLQVVIVDGFSDFTTTQYEILHMLAARVDEMYVTLPLESPLRRKDLFAKPLAALQRLEQSATVQHDQSTAALSAPHGVSHVAAELFENPRDVVPSAEAEGITIIEAAGQQGEVRAIAAEVKTLLASGTPPTDIVVTFRSLTEYADLIRETFSAAGIPHVCKSQRSLANAPVTKLLMALLQVAADDWPFERLLPLLENSYFQPDWPEFSGGAATRDVAAQLRRFQLRGGRREILSRLNRAAQAPEPDEGTTNPERRIALQQSAASAMALLTRLADLLQPLQSRHTLRGWAEILVRIGREIRLDSRALPATTDARAVEIRREETEAWTTLENTLYAAVAFQERLGSDARTIDLARLLEELTDLVRQTELRDRESAAGKVRVLDATHVRNLDVPVLFVGGLTESGFPLRRGDDCFFSEADRREFNERGLPLDHRTSRTQDEMLLFYGVVTRAREQLILSYPAMNPAGQPVLPSPYLLTLQNLFTDDAISVKRCTELDPVPSDEEILTAADLRVVAVDQALHKSPGLLRAFFDSPGAEAVVRGILAAATMADFRFRHHGFSPYEGIIPGPKYQKLLSERYSIAHQFSATELEAYAACPFRFFATHILNVAALEPPEVKTEYRQRGNVVHVVLKQLHQQYLAEIAASGAAAPSDEEFTARFDELLREQIRQHVDDPKLQQALDDIELQLLSEWGEQYARQWADYTASVDKAWDAPPQPAHYEVAFGAAPGDETDAAPAADCLVLGVAHRTVRIRGRIDRIDVGQVAGSPAFVVVDYKTGSSRKLIKKDFLAGRLVQLPLYAMAAQRLGLVAENAQPMHLGYWMVKETGFKNMLAAGEINEEQFTASEAWQQLQAILEETIPKMAAGIRKGEFPVYNPDKQCTANCPFKTTCRVGQIRPLAETLHKTWDLNSL